MKWSVVQRSVAGLGLALFLTLLGGLGSYHSTGQLMESAKWVEHTHEVLQSLEALAANLRDLESSVRGYLITGSVVYLEKQDQSGQNVRALLATLRLLTSDNAKQQSRLDDLDRRVAAKLAFMQQIVEARGGQEAEDARALLATGDGKASMDAIERILQVMRDEERDLMQHRLGTRMTAARAMLWWIGMGTTLTILLIATTGFFLVREVRQRQRTSTALRNQTSVFESILRCMSDGVIVADADSRFTQFNPAAERILGVGMTTLAAASWTQTYHLFRPDLITPFAAEDVPLARAIRGEDVDNAELFIRHPDRPAGTWISASSRPLFDELNHNIGGIVVIRDTTEQKRVESEIRRYSEHLELANRELDSKAQSLARANRDLEQFAYIASHDLQEPLRMVASFCQLLKKRYRGQFDEKADRRLDFATDGATRMQVLIQDLLQYSRAGRSDKPTESVDLNAVLKDVLVDLSLAIQDAAAEVHLDSLPAVMGDPTQLHQLFQNLIANALKFRGAEPLVIRVSSRPAGELLECTIRDNGIGIESKHFDRIFKIFHRLHSKEDYAGTGIGLAVCSKIVERHGGRIWVTSELNRGTEFHFTLSPTGSVQSAVHEPELQLI